MIDLDESWDVSPQLSHIDRLKDSLSLHGRSQDLPPIGAMGRGARPSQCKVLRASARSHGVLGWTIYGKSYRKNPWKISHRDPWELFYRLFQMRLSSSKKNNWDVAEAFLSRAKSSLRNYNCMSSIIILDCFGARSDLKT